MSQIRHLKAVILDWAGTTVDHGSCAPAFVFQEIFRRRKITVTPQQAREPMGRAKRDHIAAIVQMPEVADQWRQVYGEPCSDGDIDAMYADFLPLQKEVLGKESVVIDGIVSAVSWCRGQQLKIGSSTGYTSELLEIVATQAAAQGYQPDVALSCEDAPAGRPAPFLIYEAALRMQVFPLWHLVKVDDTPVGIEAGRNAGCWTIGITRTGNEVGLSAAEYQALSAKEQKQRCDAAGKRLMQAGAHYLAESVADLPDVLLQIDDRINRGEFPTERGRPVLK